jgi:hypothetical protein
MLRSFCYSHLTRTRAGESLVTGDKSRATYGITSVPQNYDFSQYFAILLEDPEHGQVKPAAARLAKVTSLW